MCGSRTVLIGRTLPGGRMASAMSSPGPAPAWAAAGAATAAVRASAAHVIRRFAVICRAGPLVLWRVSCLGRSERLTPFPYVRCRFRVSAAEDRTGGLVEHE